MHETNYLIPILSIFISLIALIRSVFLDKEYGQLHLIDDQDMSFLNVLDDNGRVRPVSDGYNGFIFNNFDIKVLKSDIYDVKIVTNYGKIKVTNNNHVELKRDSVLSMKFSPTLKLFRGTAEIKISYRDKFNNEYYQILKIKSPFYNNDEIPFSWFRESTRSGKISISNREMIIKSIVSKYFK